MLRLATPFMAPEFVKVVTPEIVAVLAIVIVPELVKVVTPEIVVTPEAFMVPPLVIVVALEIAVTLTGNVKLAPVLLVKVGGLKSRATSVAKVKVPELFMPAEKAKVAEEKFIVPEFVSVPVPEIAFDWKLIVLPELLVRFVLTVVRLGKLRVVALFVNVVPEIVVKLSADRVPL